MSLNLGRHRARSVSLDNARQVQFNIRQPKQKPARNFLSKARTLFKIERYRIVI
jgi:hypothetical protein